MTDTIQIDCSKVKGFDYDVIDVEYSYIIGKVWDSDRFQFRQIPKAVSFLVTHTDEDGEEKNITNLPFDVEDFINTKVVEHIIGNW